MVKTVVIDVVALSSSLIGDYTPFIQDYISRRSMVSINPMLPAMTTAVQSTYLTAKWPSEHGIVGNGWYDKAECEIKFWKQSNKLVSGEKIWDRARAIEPGFTCSNMFWWYNMYSSVDFSVTPRPNYLADGRKIPDCYSQPAKLRDYLQTKLGQFPLFQFWGPGANIKSSHWIADASMLTDERHDPTLTLIYLPHLDYCLQKFGPKDAAISKELEEIDKVVMSLVNYYESKHAEIIILSEYGIGPVNEPIYLNRLFREQGLLQVREERGLELLDAGASKAFAVADHQIAHVYLNDPSVKEKVHSLISSSSGIAMILDKKEQERYHIAHERSGDFVIVAEPNGWFAYYFWFDDKKAPDYARSVDIHKKPGYDPVEMFMTSKMRAGYKLMRKKSGLRYVMDVIPLDANLIKGSHGSVGVLPEYYPVLISDHAPGSAKLVATDVYEVIWNTLMQKH